METIAGAGHRFHRQIVPLADALRTCNRDRVRAWATDLADRLILVGWLVVSWTLRALPLPLTYRLANIAGAATFATWPRGRRSTIRNFSVVLDGAPPAAVRRVARQSMQNYCRYLVDFARLSGRNPRTPAVRRGLSNLTRLREVLDEGCGVVITLTHSGNWDAAAAATVQAGFDVAVVVEPVGSPRFDRTVRRARERLGMRVLVMGRDTLAMARTLRNGGVLAVLIDRPEADTGVPVTFFGRPARVADGAARLALLNGARLVTASCTRSPYGRKLELQADFDIPIPSERTAETATRLTQALFASHQKFVRAQPSQWYMFRQFWPNGAGR